MSERNTRGKPSSNPWNKPNQPKQAPKQKSNPNLAKSSNNSEAKFKEAQKKLQAAVVKHSQGYESSSDEEDLETTEIIGKIVASYKQTGGALSSLTKTQAFLEESFLSGAISCLVCISRVKRNDEVWNCDTCFACFHLLCIQRWSKDTIIQKKHALEGPIIVKQIELSWCCPKCRYDYTQSDIPSKYLCFCKKTEQPKKEPYLVPHSCGQICSKALKPDCGHKCVLLCHPGPCPPCPVTVSVSCFCGNEPKRVQRCSNKDWSCGKPCSRLLQCGKHNCLEPCHKDECKPCPKKSLQKCICKAQVKLKDCASPTWKCDKVCGKILSCGIHSCEGICHEGSCSECPLTKPRTCPCGKTSHKLPCTQETPTCLDTCDKLLECGQHKCNLRCHRDKCSSCLEIVEKTCRCGLHRKQVQCSKPFICETKCKNIKDCTKHPCNRKCCDGNCPPCEKPCGRTLSCGNHKCASVCHRGPCFPCTKTELVSCRCEQTQITVPCGRKQRTKPPRCNQTCQIPPDCHHEQREKHRCHFGDCPPCRQVCNKPRISCEHLCQARCHTAVLTEVMDIANPSMPWERQQFHLEKKTLDCPVCTFPVAVQCFGGHETSLLDCHLAKPFNCGRQCGKLLSCGNHSCSLPCHTIHNLDDSFKDNNNCEICESLCTKPRPEGCIHACPKPCHTGDCPPCKQMLRIKCHCGLNQPYVACSEWQLIERREELQSCGNQCPKNYKCGHRCKANCHSGPCANEEQCKKKVKVFCKCKRLKKEFQCYLVRLGECFVECDEVCLKLKEETAKSQAELALKRKKEEEERNKKELEIFQKKFETKKRSRRVVAEEDWNGKGWNKRKLIMGAFASASLAVLIGLFVFLQ